MGKAVYGFSTYRGSDIAVTVQPVMKYMGSKRWMLQNGLGELIATEIRDATRFVDIFAGSAAVATHVATRYAISVVAYDLQTFSTVLARAILCRDSKLDAGQLWKNWYAQARDVRCKLRPPSGRVVTKATVNDHRRWCNEQVLPITKAYGGYYFSALQTVWLDALRATVPDDDPARSATLAAIISAASKCAAAPGHTAQPFQPTRTARPFLLEAWHKDIVANCKEALSGISELHAKVQGFAEVADANDAAASINKGDLVFVDPPYSGVHYSRFYHVLETIALGRCSPVSGSGRYPPPQERPRSSYSIGSESSGAMNDLFATIARRGGKVILTFPQRRCSNGLSGALVTALAGKHFTVEQRSVASRFSTLGGNNEHRRARRSTRELILVLRPKVQD